MGGTGGIPGIGKGGPGGKDIFGTALMNFSGKN